jgi:hypothetical protein
VLYTNTFTLLGQRALNYRKNAWHMNCSINISLALCEVIMKLQLLFLLSVSSFLNTANSTENIQTANSSGNLEMFNSVFLTLGYSNGSTKINHNETSSVVGFNSLNNTNSIMSNGIEIGAIKEVFSSSRLSLSVMTNYGIDIGKDKGRVNQTNTTYTDKLTGNHYSIGVSGNLNLEAYNMKIQPYAFSSITKTNSKYSLDYSQGVSKSTSIQYKINSQDTNIGTGVRFIDPTVKLMSYLSASYRVSDKINTSSSSTLNKTSLDLSSASSAVLRPVTFSVGFGFLF